LITRASIQNFKGIRKCDIDWLDRVNIFIGKNDVCKSTILEALYYTLKEFAGPCFLEIIGRRTNVFSGAMELWFNYNMEKEISVNLVFDNGATATTRIARVPITPRGDFDIRCTGTAELGTEKSTDTITTYSIANWKTEKTSHRRDFLDKLTEIAELGTKDYVDSCAFLDSSNRNDINSIENLFGSIKSQGKAGVFNRYLRTIFDKESGARIVNTKAQPGAPDKYRVALMRRAGALRRKVFVSGLGDGVRYGMQIIGTGLVSRNTGMFIEEIESNQHPASLRRLVNFLMDLSFKNELQLFITTHNVRAFRFFWYHFRKKEHKVDPRARNVKYFHVTRDTRTGEVNCESIDPHNAEEMSKVEADLFGT